MYKLLSTRKNTVYLLIPGSSRLDFAEHNRHEPPSIWGDLLQARAACHKGLAITLRNAIVKNLLGMQQLKDLTISWYFPRAGLISQWSVGITVMRKTIFPHTHGSEKWQNIFMNVIVISFWSKHLEASQQSFLLSSFFLVLVMQHSLVERLCCITKPNNGFYEDLPICIVTTSLIFYPKE